MYSRRGHFDYSLASIRGVGNLNLWVWKLSTTKAYLQLGKMLWGPTSLLFCLVQTYYKLNYKNFQEIPFEYDHHLKLISVVLPAMHSSQLLM
jgi:hypothetical protein